MKAEIGATWMAYCHIHLRKEVKDEFGEMVANPFYGAPYNTTTKDAWVPGFD